MNPQESNELESLKTEAKKRLPDRETDLSLKGLDGPVQIIWDIHGVPHAKVTSTSDMWFAQGYLHALDRLWGMERTRRFYHGTLAEVVGEGGVGPDRLYRRVGLMRAARNEWPHVEKEGRSVVEAYVAGVNSYLDLGNPLPIEFDLLDYTPDHWTPEDVTGRWKLICYSQAINGQIKLGRLRMLQSLGPELFAKLFPYYPSDAPTIVPQGQPAGERPMEDILKLFESAHQISGLSEFNGSNNWAVDGTLTQSDAPLIAGDPHLAITIPSFWYAQHIEGPEFAFAGASMPGVPGVSYYGHNGHTAWSMTTAGADAQDLFLENLRDGNPPQYLFKGKWQEATVHEEKIEVKGRSDPIIEQVVETHHGPIVSGDIKSGVPHVALKWSGSEIQQTFSSFVALHSAKNLQSAIDAHQKWTSHTNKIIADDTGNIGYRLTGQLPIRNGGPAHFPVPGWTGEHEWTDTVPFDEMPEVINPAEHFLNTSNNLIAPFNYPHYVNAIGNPDRARRVAQMLSEKTSFSLDDFMDIQMDHLNGPGLRMAHRAKTVKPATSDGIITRDLLIDWDGQHDASSGGGAAYEVLLSEIFKGTLGRIAEWMPEPKPANETIQTYMNAVLGMILSDDTTLLNHEAFPFSDWNSLLEEALDNAGTFLVKELGKDPQKWQWGDLHAIQFRHGVGRTEPAGTLLNRGPFRTGGSGETVNNTRHGGAPHFRAGSTVTYRQIIDLGDVNKSVFIVPPGQSGHVASPHYSDMLDDYFNGTYRPLFWNWDDIAEASEAQQTLSPSE